MKQVFNSVQEQIILGTIFGDGSLRRLKTPGANSSFSNTGADKFKEYIFWKYQSLKSSGLFPNGPKIITRHTDPCNKLIDFEINRVYWMLRSIRHPVFTVYYKAFYEVYGVKTVVLEYLEKLNWLGIAVWYMDDGSINHVKSDSGKCYDRITLNTQSFSQKENIIIASWFQRQFGVEFRLAKDGTGHSILRISKQNEVLSFVDNIKPYLLPCMNYKSLITRDQLTYIRS